MELDLNSIQLRICSRIKELNSNDIKPKISEISNILKDFQTETTTKNEISNLIEKGILDINGDNINLNNNFINFSWLNYLSKKQDNIIVLGMPGNHTLEFVNQLDKRDIQYIDHDIAWKSLMKNAKDTLSIISPFADKIGFKIFGPSLIAASKRKVKVEIITRELNPYSMESTRRKAFTNFFRILADEVTYPDISIYNVHDGVSNNEIALHLGSIHAKLLIQDDSAIYIGSGEFRGNSISKNVEIGYIVTKTSAIKPIKEIFEAVKEIGIKLKWKELL